MLKRFFLYAAALGALAVSSVQAAAGCDTSSACEDFTDYGIGIFEPVRSITEQDAQGSVLFSNSSTANQILSQVVQGKYLRQYETADSSGAVMQARVATPFLLDINNQISTHDALVKVRVISNEDNFAPIQVISTGLSLRAIDANTTFGFYEHAVEIEGIGPNQYRVYALGVDQTYNTFRSDGLSITVAASTDLIEITTTTDFENLTQSVLANGALVHQWSVPDIFTGVENQYSWTQQWEIFSGINFYNNAVALDIDDIAFEGIYYDPGGPSIEPGLAISQGPTRVGDKLFFTVTADPDADWTLYLGETDDQTQTERTVSSDDFDAGVAIPVQYYKAADDVEPRLSIDGREITLESPISVSCYIEASAYPLSKLISATDCDGY